MHETSVAAESTGRESIALSEQIGRYLLLLLQLGLIGGVIYFFEVESRRHLLALYGVMIAGFAVHVWLPRERGLSFFALLSVASVPLLLGPADGLWVIAIGAVLIGVCYLPLRFWTRVLLLVICGAGLIVLRTNDASPVWPVLGSMFMFRLLLYVYSTRHLAAPPPVRTTASYFFLIPNVCFPLFPVVDFETFCEKRFDVDAWDIYQEGVTWIVRGIAHLLLYRLIQTSLVPEPYELHDISTLVLFMITNYALYLQVSGHFHLITGLLHLFGFHLPRTHENFFLASSFVDIWRRINIYWRDFLAKLFFFPTLYAVHGRGATMAVATVSGVGCVFLATWLLHSWQTFWLRGRFPLTLNDAALWTLAGACVAVNALLVFRAPQNPSAGTWAAAFRRAAKIACMFLLVSLFWACWTDPSFPSLVREALAREHAADGLSLVLCWVLAAILAATCLIRLNQWRTSRGFLPPRFSFRDTALLHVVGLGVFLTATSPWMSHLLTPQTAQSLAAFRSDAAAHEAARGRLRGYYEDLNEAPVGSNPLLSLISPFEPASPRQAAGFEKASRSAGVDQGVELIPGVETELGGSHTSVNQFGMRDRAALTLGKAPGTVRIAMVGSSVVMGYGVEDDEVFARGFESRLNAASAGSRYEVLNFGVGKQWASHRLVRIQRVVLGFEPDAIYYFAHQDEFEESASHIAGLISAGRPLPSAHITRAVDEAGITADMAPGGIAGRLLLRTPQLIAAIYRSIVDECRQNDVLPVWIYLPIPTASASDISAELLPIARDAGFVVLDLSSHPVLLDHRRMLSTPEEMHPHAAGHEIIADALFDAVRRHPEALP